MHTRALTITALALAAAVAGPLLLPLLPVGSSAVPWFGHLLALVAGAIGVPMLLGSVGSGGNFQAVARLWAVVGGLAIVLAAAGASAVAVSLGTGAVSRVALLALSAGAGLLAGLAIVKAAIRQGRARAAR